MADAQGRPLSVEEIDAEGATALPDKEVLSLLDLNADLDIALAAAAPIDLAVAANANIAAPIDAAVSANVLSFDSHATSLADQGTIIDQGITGNAAANSIQDSGIDQADDAVGGTTPVPPDPVPQPQEAIGDPLSGDLLNVNVDLAADLDLAAPINGAVAANANVAAPIDAAVAANIGSIGSDAIAVADQDAQITQNITGDATANADQTSDIEQ
jgi:hypothetical protein